MTNNGTPHAILCVKDWRGVGLVKQVYVNGVLIWAWAATDGEMSSEAEGLADGLASWTGGWEERK